MKTIVITDAKKVPQFFQVWLDNNTKRIVPRSFGVFSIHFEQKGAVSRPSPDVQHTSGSPKPVDVYDVWVAKGLETFHLRPQVVQSHPPDGEGQVLSNALSYNTVPLVLAQKHRAVTAIGDKLHDSHGTEKKCGGRERAVRYRVF